VPRDCGVDEATAADELARQASNALDARVVYAVETTECITLGQRAAGSGLDRVIPVRPNKARAPKVDHGS
jgi:hypothetical protein